MESDSYVIGIDVGGTNIRIGAVGSDHSISISEIIKKEKVLTSSDTVYQLAEFDHDPYLSSCVESAKSVWRKLQPLLRTS